MLGRNAGSRLHTIGAPGQRVLPHQQAPAMIGLELEWVAFQEVEMMPMLRFKASLGGWWHNVLCRWQFCAIQAP